jgi:hypothetical protein
LFAGLTNQKLSADIKTMSLDKSDLTERHIGYGFTPVTSRAPSALKRCI